MQADLDRFLALVRREFGAEDARVLEADAEAPEGELALVCRLPDGRAVVATFVAAPADREAKERRLEMLVSTLDVALDEPVTGGDRAPR